MSWTQADLDKLDSAIGQGVTEVTFANGQSVRYRSLKEMMQVRRLMIRELQLTTKPRRVSPVYDRGFG